jgi:hypothetical protein
LLFSAHTQQSLWCTLRTTAAQRAAEIDAEHKLIAEVAGGKKVRQPRKPKADAATTEGKKVRQPRKPAADKK